MKWKFIGKYINESLIDSTESLEKVGRTMNDLVTIKVIHMELFSLSLSAAEHASLIRGQHLIIGWRVFKYLQQ